jgi:hypothetical protein
MKTTILKTLFMTLLSGALFMGSCVKSQPDNQSAEDDARGSYIMADAFAVGNNEAGGGGGKSIPGCMTVVRNLDTNPKTVDITFDNCDYRGAVRNGIIHASFSLGPEGLRAVSASLTFENYTFEGIAVEGTITSTFGGTLLLPEIHVVSENMVLTFTDSRSISYSSDMTFAFVNGLGDGILENVVIEVSGTADGVNRQGKSYTSVYNAVRFEGSCGTGYPVSGTVTINSDKGESVIDFGDGTCDKIITVTNGNASITITLN